MEKEDEKKPGDDLTIVEIQELWKENRSLWWSRTQTLYVVEAATLWGAYYVYDKSHFGLAAVVLVLGFWVMFVLFLVMHRDLKVHNYFKQRIILANKYGNFGRHLWCLDTKYMVLSVPAVLALTNAVLVVWLLYKVCSLG